MSTLSVVMIVKNEAHGLAQCLRSVRGIADEIVIGDTGSTDATDDVARGFGAKILTVAWNNDFAAARNAALAAACGEWLLHLDADEVLDPAGAARIRALVDADGGGADAIEVTLANYCNEPRAWRWVACAPDDPFARGYAGYLQTALPRLFRNGCGFEYREPVHENITESVWERGGVIRAEPIIIHHYGYQPAGELSAAKKRLYLDIGRAKVEQRPEDPKAWHDLAEQLLACGRAEDSEQACRRALARDPRHIGAVTTLANLLLNRGDHAEARELLERLEAEGPVPPHVVTALGAIAIRQGRVEEARARLEAVRAANPNAIMAALYLARAYDCLGETAQAQEVLERTRSAVPALREARERVDAHRLRREGTQLAGNGLHQRALALLVEALQLDPEDPMIHARLGEVLAALGERERARRSFERALLLAPSLAAVREQLE